MNKLVYIFLVFFIVSNNNLFAESRNVKQIILAFTHPVFSSCKNISLTELLSFSGDRLVISSLKKQKLKCPQGELNQAQVEEQLKFFLKDIDTGYSVKLRWKGARKVKFKKNNNSSIDSELKVWGKEFLEKELTLLTAEKVLITMQVAREKPIAGNGFRLLEVKYGVGCRLSHKTCLHFYFIDSIGNQYQRKRWFEVNALLPTAVAARRLPNLAEVNAQTCVVKYVALSLLRKEAIPDCKLIREMITQNRYLSGQAFELSRLAPLPEVKKGDLVNVSISRGSISIQAEGVVWASALLGELVLVSLNKNNLPFLARVEGKGRVVVDEN